MILTFFKVSMLGGARMQQTLEHIYGPACAYSPPSLLLPDRLRRKDCTVYLYLVLMSLQAIVL